jgi:hypothetical protein
MNYLLRWVSSWGVLSLLWGAGAEEGAHHPPEGDTPPPKALPAQGFRSQRSDSTDVCNKKRVRSMSILSSPGRADLGSAIPRFF